MRKKIKEIMIHKLEQVSQTLGKQPLIKGALPAMIGSGLTFLQNIEIWLRISGAFVGLIIGLLTLYSMIKKMRKK